MFVLNGPDKVPQGVCFGAVAVDYGEYVKIVTVMFFSGISEILSIKKLSTAW